MNFDYPPEAEAFRLEFRAWLATNLTDEVRSIGTAIGIEHDDPRLETLLRWNQLLADARYAAIAWPVEWGGRGAGIMEQVVFAEEMHLANAPGPVNIIGLSNIAPAIMEYGTEDQKQNLLPRMLRGDDIWCQGFSEPDAGSDLAALGTSAVLDGDTWVVNGQKTWNTLGNLSDYCEILVRTDRTVAKHKGITCLLLDMRADGVEVRPLTTIKGDAEFSEIFLTDVRVPTDMTLGPVNDGWRVAMTTLTYERAGVARLHLGLRSKVQSLLELAKTSPGPRGYTRASDDPILRNKLARCYAEAEILKLIADRAISAELNGEQPGAESSIAKLLWSDTEQRIATVAIDVLGPGGLGGKSATDLLAARSYSIAGGTTQINKDVVAQRVLGLPRS